MRPYEQCRGKIIFAAAVLLTLACCGCGRSNAVTLENFKRLSPGMSPAEVEALLGTGREETAADPIRIMIYEAPATAEQPTAAITVTFIDEKLTASEQQGLGP